MFRQSRDEADNIKPLRKLVKRPDTSIIRHPTSDRDLRSRDRPIAKIRKDRKTNIAQIHDEADEEVSRTEREWEIPNLRNWSFDIPLHSYEPIVESIRTIPMSPRDERQPSPSEASSCDSHRRSPTHGSFSWPRPPSRRAEPLSTLTATEEHLIELPVAQVKRFYQDRDVEDKLTGPENYARWARDMERKLTECNAWPIISQSLSAVPSDSCFHVQWARHNKNAWLMITGSVSREIRRVLCQYWRLDTPGAWLYLRETYASVPATTLCSVRGVRDMLDLKYEECASMKDFLGLMVQYCHAIECNRQGKRGNEWLWCQVILMKLGPKWSGWVVDLMERVKESDSPLDSLVDMHRLAGDLLYEDTQRRMAEEQRRRLAGESGKPRFELA